MTKLIDTFINFVNMPKNTNINNIHMTDPPTYLTNNTLVTTYWSITITFTAIEASNL